MLYEISALILDVVGGLIAGACLLRWAMQRWRVPFGNPMGQLVFALTNWLVLPLRKVVPAVGTSDTSSVLGAFLVELAQFGVLWLVASGSAPWLAVPVLALFGLARLVVSTLTVLLIVYAIASWVQAHSQLSDLVARLVAPMLRPLRRLVPLVGGVDLSPLALLLTLQIGAIVLRELQRAALNAL
jgi:YggT family protein